MSLLEHSCAISSETSLHTEVCGTLGGVEPASSPGAWSLWMQFKKVQLEMLHQEAECSDDEGDADFDGEEGLSCDARGKPQVKKVLRLLTPMSTCWNSMYYLIQRALVLKNLLTKFTNHVQSTFLGEVPPPQKSPNDDSADAPLWRPSCHKIPISPYK